MKLHGLDSLRFVGFLLLFICHTVGVEYYGYKVVSFFFILSSFLLTYLSLTEIDKTGRFSKTNFFMRRMLRIFPLYYLVLLFSFFLLPILSKSMGMDITLPEKKYLYYFFLSNYDNSDHLFSLKFLWSIAVEEQFYLFFLLLSPLYKKYFLIPLLLMLVIYCCYMNLIDHFELTTFGKIFPHFANFLSGMAAAWYFKYKTYTLKSALVLFIVTSLLVFAVSSNDTLFNLLVSIDFGILILLTLKFFSTKKNQNLKFVSIMEKLGVYTYGLYVYSGFVITFGLKYIDQSNLLIAIVLELLILILIASLSYHLYEKHFLQLKKYFR